MRNSHTHKIQPPNEAKNREEKTFLSNDQLKKETHRYENLLRSYRI